VTDNTSDADRSRKVVFKITYPNGKIYIGVDWRYCLNYFGSASSQLIARDFPWSEQIDFSIRKEILWWSDTATKFEAFQKEIELIRTHQSNNPDVGYNRTPRYYPPEKEQRRMAHGLALNSSSADGDIMRIPPSVSLPITSVKASETPNLLFVEWTDGLRDEIDLTGMIHGYVALAPLENPEVFGGVVLGEGGWFVAWPDVSEDAAIATDTLRRLAHEPEA